MKKMMYGLFTATLITTATFVSGVADAAPVLADGSFESPSTTSYVYNPTVAGVTFNGGSGVQRNGSAFGFANAPDGVQTGFLQSTSTFTGQITFALTNLVVGQAYDIGFSGSGRAGYGTNPFTVALNGAALGSYTIASTSWQSFTTNSFVATATTAALSFTASATTTGDNDVGLDNVTIAAVPEPAAWAMIILGMGTIGFAMRRQKTATRVSYAA